MKISAATEKKKPRLFGVEEGGLLEVQGGRGLSKKKKLSNIAWSAPKGTIGERETL